MEKEAYLYEKLDNDIARCMLCHHRCRISPGERGICRVRENRNGILYTLVYDRVVSMNRDPIEKKPFYHFFPGTGALSIATVGCNFNCLHCQNYEISQFPKLNGRELPGRPVSPEEIVDKALKTGCKSISYTYTEPTIYFELAYDTAKLAVEKGLKNSFVTNGYMTEEALMKILPYMHAANIDLKSFRDVFYKKICGARIQPVLSTIKKMFELEIWIEITTLIIPGENDEPNELRQIAEFIAQLSKEIPWHVSAFYPHFRMEDIPPTNPEIITRARSIGRSVGLKYIFSGNIWGDPGAHTYCPKCESIVIERQGYRITTFNVSNGCCLMCSSPLAGFF